MSAPEYSKEQLQNIIQNAAVIRTDELQLTGLQGSLSTLSFLNRYMPYIKGLAVCCIVVISIIVFRLVDNNLRMYIKCDMGNTIASNVNDSFEGNINYNTRALGRPENQSCDQACEQADLQCCILAYKVIPSDTGDKVQFDSCSMYGIFGDNATCICQR